MPTVALTALLVLAVVPVVAVVVLVVIVAAGSDVPEWVPPAFAVTLAALSGGSLARARGSSRAVATLFGLGAAAVAVGLIYLLALGLGELVEGPGGP